MHTPHFLLHPILDDTCVRELVLLCDIFGGYILLLYSFIRYSQGSQCFFYKRWISYVQQRTDKEEWRVVSYPAATPMPSSESSWAISTVFGPTKISCTAFSSISLVSTCPCMFYFVFFFICIGKVCFISWCRWQILWQQPILQLQIQQDVTGMELLDWLGNSVALSRD